MESNVKDRSKRQLEKGLRQAEDQCRYYRRRVGALAVELSNAQERERVSIATDLHDCLAQNLILAKLAVGYSRKNINQDGEHLSTIDAYLDDALETIRSIITELSPPALHCLELGAAIMNLSDDISRKHDLKIVVEDNRSSKRIPKVTRVFVFRAVQELLVNVVKHAKARSACVDLSDESQNICVKVLDDGIGFRAGDIAADSRSEGKFGLSSLRWRCENFGGRMVIRSTPGKGSVVTLILPNAANGI